METMQTVTLVVDSDELDALQKLIALVGMTKESQELLLKATPFLANLRVTYEELTIPDKKENLLKKLKKKDEIELLKTTIEQQKWQISGLMVQAMLSKQMTFFARQNNTSVIAADLTDPDKIKLRCVYHGDFEVRPRNIIAIKSNGKLKKLYLKEPICPLRSSTKRISFDVKLGFDEIITKLQKQIQIFFRVHDSYAVNLFEYRLLRQGIFVLKDETLMSENNNSIQRIKTDFKFNAQNYQNVLEEIETYEAEIANFGPSKEKFDHVNGQMEYFKGKYGNKARE